MLDVQNKTKQKPMTPLYTLDKHTCDTNGNFNCQPFLENESVLSQPFHHLSCLLETCRGLLENGGSELQLRAEKECVISKVLQSSYQLYGQNLAFADIELDLEITCPLELGIQKLPGKAGEMWGAETPPQRLPGNATGIDISETVLHTFKAK